MARLTIRIDFCDGDAIGPGKIRLLEFIGSHGSIAAAGRAMGMSYRQAWLLIADLNRCFRQPVVTKHLGGREGGGAALTQFGRRLVGHYRRIEARSARACARSLKALDAAVSSPSSRRRRARRDADAV